MFSKALFCVFENYELKLYIIEYIGKKSNSDLRFYSTIVCLDDSRYWHKELKGVGVKNTSTLVFKEIINSYKDFCSFIKAINNWVYREKSQILTYAFILPYSLSRCFKILTSGIKRSKSQEYKLVFNEIINSFKDFYPFMKAIYNWVYREN